MMYLLIRKVSEYDGPPLLLGLFDSQENAQRARGAYLASLAHGDLWCEQSYRQADPAQDVMIERMDGAVGERSEGYDTLYLLQRYIEGFGQIYCDYLAAYAYEEEARRKADELDADEQESFPRWHQVRSVSVNRLLEPDYERWRKGDYD